MDLKELFYSSLLGNVRPVREIIEKDHRGLLNTPLRHFLSFKDAVKKNVEVYKLSTEVIRERNISDEFYFAISTADLSGGFGVNSSLFYPTLYMLCNDSQRKRWCKDVIDGRLVGAYAQTEMRHGSDVQSLQTTATFDPQTSSFILNTPKLSDSKFWPGGMGITCTHILTHARTYINGKYHGIQTFMLQIRDPKTFQTLDGIEVGDIGEKLGFRSVDNGYLRFNNVRVPWDQLLMRYFEIDEKGNVLTEDSQNAKFGYGGMLNLRNQIVRYVLIHYAWAAFWSYDIIKNQENIDKTFVTNRYIHRTAHVITYTFLTVQLRALHSQFMNALAVNDLSTAKVLLVDLHLMSAGYKSLGTWDAIRLCREALSESAQAGLYVTERPFGYVGMVPTATYEGDNSVLLQQLSRVLIRYIEILMKGKQIKGVGASFNIYAKNVQEREELPTFDLETEALTFDSVEKLLRDIAFKNIAVNAEKFMMMMGESDMTTVWNEKMQNDLVYMSKVYLYYQAYQYSLTYYKSVQSKVESSANKLVSNLLLLDGLNSVKELYNLGTILGMIKGKKAYERLVGEIQRLEDALRPHAEEIRKSVMSENQEMGFTTGFDSKVIEEEGKTVHQETEKTQKAFAMQFLKMSKL